MAEDAGKKRFIRDFLQRIKIGDGFYDDLRIERVVRLPGSEGEGSTARSLSGKTVNNITQLLEDDLRHSFDNGFFTFRLVNAHLGSGKTTLLCYLYELAKTQQIYKNFSVVSNFRLSDIIGVGGNQSFNIKLYLYILGETFWELLNSSSLPVKQEARQILNDYLEPSELNQLASITSSSPFCAKFRKYLSESGIVFENFFFEVINRVTKVEPRFTFAYLIDELDFLAKDFPVAFQETKALIKALVRGASQNFDSKIRLLIYLAGTAEAGKDFVSEDPVIESLIGQQVIILSKGYENEFEMIRSKIDDRIKGAFSGYKNFNQAWGEIENIYIDRAQNLRSFYQNYVTPVLEIYEKYFSEEPEKSFEGNSRDLVEAQCRLKWQRYLSLHSYTLSPVSTTTVLQGHAFDCYVELLHNGSCVARGFGEAKNYELLSSHLETFNKWLEDVRFQSHVVDGNPSDLAFMIAPSCPSLLQRKLELRDIDFIQASKVTGNGVTGNGVTGNGVTGNGVKDDPLPVNLNIAKKELIVMALKGTGIRGATIDRLMKSRDNKPYENLDQLVSGLNLTVNVEGKLNQKLKKNEICFS